MIDYTLRLSDFLMIFLTLFLAPSLWRGGKALFAMRDSIKDLTRAMGTNDPPSGVLGDVAHLKREARRHRDWLIEAGIINPNDRT